MLSAAGMLLYFRMTDSPNLSIHRVNHENKRRRLEVLRVTELTPRMRRVFDERAQTISGAVATARAVQAEAQSQAEAASAEVAKAHLVVGSYAELKAVGSASNLAGKTVITSNVNDLRLAHFKDAGVNMVVDWLLSLHSRPHGDNA